MERQKPWQGCARCAREHIRCTILAGWESCIECACRNLVCMIDVRHLETWFYKPRRRIECIPCRQREPSCAWLQGEAVCAQCKEHESGCNVIGGVSSNDNIDKPIARIASPLTACTECRSKGLRCIQFLDDRACQHCEETGSSCTIPSKKIDHLSVSKSDHMLEATNKSPVEASNSRHKPQCWDHGCNGRQFTTFSNLLRHQREKSGTAAKARCPHCGVEFSRVTARNGHMYGGRCTAMLNGSTESIRSRNSTPPKELAIPHASTVTDAVNIGTVTQESHLQTCPGAPRIPFAEIFSGPEHPTEDKTTGHASLSQSLYGNESINRTQNGSGRPSPALEPLHSWDSWFSVPSPLPVSRKRSASNIRDTAYCLKCKMWTSTCICDQGFTVASASEFRHYRACSSAASSDGAHYESRSRANSLSFKNSRDTMWNRNRDHSRSRMVRADSEPDFNHLNHDIWQGLSEYGPPPVPLIPLSLNASTTFTEQKDPISNKEEKDGNYRANKVRRLSVANSDSNGSWEINSQPEFDQTDGQANTHESTDQTSNHLDHVTESQNQPIHKSSSVEHHNSNREDDVQPPTSQTKDPTPSHAPPHREQEKRHSSRTSIIKALRARSAEISRLSRSYSVK